MLEWSFCETSCIKASAQSHYPDRRTFRSTSSNKSQTSVPGPSLMQLVEGMEAKTEYRDHDLTRMLLGGMSIGSWTIYDQ